MLITSLVLALVGAAQEPAPVSFTRDVAPIFVRRCYGCHGGEKRKSGYSLDTLEVLLRPGRGGDAPVVARDVEASALWRLVNSADEFERMPPEGDGLPATELEILKRWIEEGAAFDGERAGDSLSTYVRGRVHPPAPQTYPHPIPVQCAVFSPDGNLLLSTGYRELLVWRVADGALVRRIGGLPPRITAMRWNPAVPGELAVIGGVAGEYGELRTVDFEAGSVGPVWEVFADLPLGLAWSPDGALLAVGGADSRVRCFRHQDRSLAWESRLHSDWVCAVDFNRDGTLLGTASRDHSARIFDPLSGELITNYTRHTQTLPDQQMYQHKVWVIDFDDAGPAAVTGGEGSRLHVWDPAAYMAEDGTAAQMETRFKSKSSVRFLQCEPSDTLSLLVHGGVCYSGTASGDVFIHRLADQEELARVQLRSPIFTLALAPDGKALAAGDARGTVHFVRLQGEPEVALRFFARP